MDRESVLFYLRVVLFPLAISATFLRATFSTWSMLERAHQSQEARYQRLWGQLPASVQALIETDNAEKISDTTVRRFARMLADYNLVKDRLDGARELGMKSQFINAFDAGHRRLRNAELREQAVVETVGRIQ